MRIAIIEDERKSFEYLRGIIKELVPNAQFIPQIDSVTKSIEILNSASVDLIFMDIQLSDGLSFEIFNAIRIETPIIFTTAFDQYAVEAFKHNGIDYLLKPIMQQDVKRAVDRVKSRSKDEIINNLQQLIHGTNRRYKSRFLVKTGGSFRFIDAHKITHIQSEDGLTLLYIGEKERYLYSKSVDQVSGELNPHDFFQINRGQIIAIDAIDKVHPYLNQRLKVELHFPSKDEMIVSKQRATAFKAWLNQ